MLNETLRAWAIDNFTVPNDKDMIVRYEDRTTFMFGLKHCVIVTYRGEIILEFEIPPDALFTQLVNFK